MCCSPLHNFKTASSTGSQLYHDYFTSWLHGRVAERRSVTGELSCPTLDLQVTTYVGKPSATRSANKASFPCPTLRLQNIRCWSVLVQTSGVRHNWASRPPNKKYSAPWNISVRSVPATSAPGRQSWRGDQWRGWSSCRRCWAGHTRPGHVSVTYCVIGLLVGTKSMTKV